MGRAWTAVSPRRPDGLARHHHRRAEFFVVAGQFAFVRFRPGLALRVRRRHHRWHRVARRPFAAPRVACRIVRRDAMTPLALPSNPRVLVVALRRLGDVLLTTPLIRSIKRAFPTASIEALVFAGTEGILAGNPDLAKVIAMPQRPGAGETLSLLRRLARRYDVALSTQSGDRPTLLAWIAGRQSAGPLEPDGLSATVKRLALSRSYVVDRQQHRVRDVLRLAELLGIAAVPEIVCPAGGARSSLIPAQPYAVVHAAPMFVYKRWTMDGWRALAVALRQRGLAVVASGANSDRAYLDEVWRDGDVTRLDGRLDWPELAAAIAT